MEAPRVIASPSSVLRDIEGFASGVEGGIYFYVLAIVVYFASSLLWGFRWWFILRRLGDRVSYLDAYTAIMGGILFNNITPSLKMGGESFRAAWVWLTDRVPLDRTILSILYERLTEVPGVAIVAIIAVSSGLVDIVHASHPFTLSAATLAAGLGLGRVRDLWRDLKRRVSTDARTLLRDVRLTAVSVSIGVLIWLQDITRFYLIGRAVGLSLSIGQASILSVSYLVLGMTPTPAGVGFVEGGLTSILYAMGYPLDKAVLLVVGERLISSVMSSLVGLILVLTRGGAKMLKEAGRIARGMKGGVQSDGIAADSVSVGLVQAENRGRGDLYL